MGCYYFEQVKKAFSTCVVIGSCVSDHATFQAVLFNQFLIVTQTISVAFCTFLRGAHYRGARSLWLNASY